MNCFQDETPDQKRIRYDEAGRIMAFISTIEYMLAGDLHVGSTFVEHPPIPGLMSRTHMLRLPDEVLTPDIIAEIHKGLSRQKEALEAEFYKVMGGVPLDYTEMPE